VISPTKIELGGCNGDVESMAIQIDVVMFLGSAKYHTKATVKIVTHILKGTVHPKNDNSDIIYSPSCGFKPACFGPH